MYEKLPEAGLSPENTSARNVALPPIGMVVSFGVSWVSFTLSAVHFTSREAEALSPSWSVAVTVAVQGLHSLEFSTLARASLASCAQPPQVHLYPPDPSAVSAVSSTMSPKSA